MTGFMQYKADISVFYGMAAVPGVVATPTARPMSQITVGTAAEPVAVPDRAFELRVYTGLLRLSPDSCGGGRTRLPWPRRRSLPNGPSPAASALAAERALATATIADCGPAAAAGRVDNRSAGYPCGGKIRSGAKYIPVRP